MSTGTPGIGTDTRDSVRDSGGAGFGAGGAGTGTEPGTGTADWQRLSPLTAVPTAIVLAAFLIPAAAIGAVVTGLNGAFLPWGALIIAGGVLGIAVPAGTEALRWSRSRYRVTDERLEARSGVLVTERRSVPRDRIRSVDVSVPIWLRPFGLCSVAIGTGQNAGSGGGDVRLSYTTRAEGGRLRGELLLRDYTRPAGGGAGDGGSGTAGGSSSAHLCYTGRELARLRPVWFGFAPASVATPLLGAGAIGTAFNVLSWFGQARANAAAVAVYHQFIAQPLIVLCGTAATVLLIGAAAATAVQVEAWWGYRLDREPDGTLRLSRGLVTSTSLSLEERRLRGVELREPAPLRWVGGARVRAVATGLGSNAQNGGTVSRSALSPDMPRARALRLSADAAREAEPPTGAALRPHPGAALQRRITRALVGTAVLAAAAAGTAAAASAAQEWAAVGTWGPAAAAGALAGALLLVPWALGSYRGLGHTIVPGVPGYFVTRKGVLARSTVALRRDGIIGWRISRSPFQRWAGLATVAATTSGGTGRYAAVDMELGAGLRLADEAVPELLGQFLVAARAQRAPAPKGAAGGTGISGGAPSRR